MKVGSLVEFIWRGNLHPSAAPFIKWMPVAGEIYTVRAMVKYEIDPEEQGPTILLEEGCVGAHPSGGEFGFSVGAFREVQPPMGLSELLETSEPGEVTCNHPRLGTIILKTKPCTDGEFEI